MFLLCDAMCNGYHAVSVCPFCCLSHSCIVLNTKKNFLTIGSYTILVFDTKHYGNIPMGTP